MQDFSSMRKVEPVVVDNIISPATSFTPKQNNFFAFVSWLKSKHLIPQKTKPALFMGAVIFAFINLIGIVAALVLIRTNSDIRQQAYVYKVTFCEENTCQPGLICNEDLDRCDLPTASITQCFISTINPITQECNQAFLSNAPWPECVPSVNPDSFGTAYSQSAELAYTSCVSNLPNVALTPTTCYELPKPQDHICADGNISVKSFSNPNDCVDTAQLYRQKSSRFDVLQRCVNDNASVVARPCYRALAYTIGEKQNCREDARLEDLPYPECIESGDVNQDGTRNFFAESPVAAIQACQSYVGQV